jgi:hypothetical protein
MIRSSVDWQCALHTVLSMINHHHLSCCACHDPLPCQRPLPCQSTSPLTIIFLFRCGNAHLGIARDVRLQAKRTKQYVKTTMLTGRPHKQQLSKTQEIHQSPRPVEVRCFLSQTGYPLVSVFVSHGQKPFLFRPLQRQKYLQKRRARERNPIDNKRTYEQTLLFCA